jgi:hypothetical protein
VPKLGDCGGLTDKNRSVLGDRNPANGEPTYRGPSSAFVRWYSKCLVEIVDKDIGTSYPSEMRRFFGERATLLSGGDLARAREVLWEKLPAESRHEIVQNLVRVYLGPGSAATHDLLAKRLETAIATVGGKFSVYDATKRLLFYIGMQDDFLTY